MPFIRVGLCATDQRKCANMLESGVDPREVAAKLHTSVETVEKFTDETLKAVAVRNKKIEAAAVKHAKDTNTTAAALAGAAKEILSQVPEIDPSEFE